MKLTPPPTPHDAQSTAARRCGRRPEGREARRG